MRDVIIECKKCGKRLTTIASFLARNGGDLQLDPCRCTNQTKVFDNGFVAGMKRVLEDIVNAGQDASGLAELVMVIFEKFPEYIEGEDNPVQTAIKILKEKSK